MGHGFPALRGAVVTRTETAFARECGSRRRRSARTVGSPGVSHISTDRPLHIRSFPNVGDREGQRVETEVRELKRNPPKQKRCVGGRPPRVARGQTVLA